MKQRKTLFLVSILLFLVLSAANVAADDFDWMRDLSITAEADPSGFRARLAVRFNIGDAQINAVIGNVGGPAEAYLVFRYGELSGRPADYVIERYRSEKGWGALAKSLGIEPGSKEFHALKRGHDLYDHEDNDKNMGKGKGKN